MTVRDELYTRLTTGSTTLTGLVGTRVYRTIAPQNPTYPCVVYTRVTGPRIHDLTGPTGQSEGRFEVSAIAKTAAAVEDVAEAVRGVLDGWTSTGLVQNSRLTGEVDIYYDDLQVYQIALDFVLMHDE